MPAVYSPLLNFTLLFIRLRISVNSSDAILTMREAIQKALAHFNAHIG